MSEKENTTNTKEMEPINRLTVYVICFSIAASVLIGFLDLRYGIFFKGHDEVGAFFVGLLSAIFLFGIVLSIWRMVNRPKPPEKIIEKVIVQQKQPTQQTPVQQTQKKSINTPKPM
jgi:hypothetical protein